MAKNFTGYRGIPAPAAPDVPSAARVRFIAQHSVTVHPARRGIHLVFEAKVLIRTRRCARWTWNLSLRDSSVGSCRNTSERLLMEALHGDASLFTRSDGIETAWKLVNSIANGWETRNIPDLSLYRRGSWGPSEANALLARDERSWQLGCVGE